MESDDGWSSRATRPEKSNWIGSEVTLWTSLTRSGLKMSARFRNTAQPWKWLLELQTFFPNPCTNFYHFRHGKDYSFWFLRFFLLPNNRCLEPTSDELHQTGPLKDAIPTEQQRRGKSYKHREPVRRSSRVLMVLDKPVLRVDTDAAAVDGVVDGQVWQRRRSREVNRSVFQGVDPNLVVDISCRWAEVGRAASGGELRSLTLGRRWRYRWWCSGMKINPFKKPLNKIFIELALPLARTRWL